MVGDYVSKETCVTKIVLTFVRACVCDVCVCVWFVYADHCKRENTKQHMVAKR